VRAVLTGAFLLVLAGSSATTSPLFQRANGTPIILPGTVRAWCDARSLEVASLGRLVQSRWQLEVGRKSLQQGHIISFSWRRANGIGIFVYDAKTHNEASEGAEGSRGTVTLRRATCQRGGALEIGVSGTIASEFFDGKPIRVSGTYRGTVGSGPR
jgi:hypothetical protein